MQALVSSTLPVAAFTGTRKLVLLAADAESAAVKMRFNRGIEVVAIMVTVTQTGAVVQGHVRPSIEDIDLRVESQDLRLTRDVSDENDRDSYADASAITLPFKYCMATLSGSPDVIVQARWKSPDHAALYLDAIVSISLLYNWEGKP